MSRACVIVLDGVGAGALPDADRFGDEGSNTLGNVARAVGGLDLPNMEALGLGNVAPLDGCPPQPGAPAVAGRLLERSSGKDTITGHWELMGVVTPQAMPTYPHGFPFEVIDPFMHRTGRGVLGNRIASGTEIIQALERSTNAPESGSSTPPPIPSSSSPRTRTRSLLPSWLDRRERGRPRAVGGQARRRPGDRAAVHR